MNNFELTVLCLAWTLTCYLSWYIGYLIAKIEDKNDK